MKRTVEDVVGDTKLVRMRPTIVRLVLSDDDIARIAAALLAEWPELGWECRDKGAIYDKHNFVDPNGGDSNQCWTCGAKRGQEEKP